MKASDDIADLLSAELSKLRRERDAVAEKIEALEEPTLESDLEAQIDEAVDRLWRITSELDSADPDRLRELIRRMVVRIDLHFDHVDKGTRVECPLSRGTIDLRPDPILCRLDSRGDKTAIELFRNGVIGSADHLSVACHGLTSVRWKKCSGGIADNRPRSLS